MPRWGGPARFPPAPLLFGPQPSLHSYRQLPPRVRLAWSGGAGEYHFQLARTALFERPLVDQRLNAPEFVTVKLPQGGYFWRVSRVEQGREGPFSRTGRCQLSQLLHPPGLVVEFPPVHAQSGPYTLAGRAAPGSRVYVDGAEVTTGGDGAFALPALLGSGVNLIRVEALDGVGNASYASRIVYGRD